MSISNETLMRIASEEAIRVGVTLGPEDSMHFVIGPAATEAEARERIQELLRQKKEREP